MLNGSWEKTSYVGNKKTILKIWKSLSYSNVYLWDIRLDKEIKLNKEIIKYKCYDCEKEFNEPEEILEKEKSNYSCLNGYLEECCPYCKSANIQEI